MSAPGSSTWPKAGGDEKKSVAHVIAPYGWTESGSVAVMHFPSPKMLPSPEICCAYLFSFCRGGFSPQAAGVQRTEGMKIREGFMTMVALGERNISCGRCVSLFGGENKRQRDHRHWPAIAGGDQEQANPVPKAMLVPEVGLMGQDCPRR